jgi:hypothetical protein
LSPLSSGHWFFPTLLAQYSLFSLEQSKDIFISNLGIEMLKEVLTFFVEVDPTVIAVVFLIIRQLAHPGFSAHSHFHILFHPFLSLQSHISCICSRLALLSLP